MHTFVHIHLKLMSYMISHVNMYYCLLMTMHLQTIMYLCMTVVRMCCHMHAKLNIYLIAPVHSNMFIFLRTCT